MDLRVWGHRVQIMGGQSGRSPGDWETSVFSDGFCVEMGKGATGRGDKE